MTAEQHFEAWAVVALFGHKQLAGRVSEQTIGGETFIRVDVPTGPETYHTSLFGKGAIYSIQLTDEAIAREYAKRVNARPVSSYDVAQLLKDNPQPALPRRDQAYDNDGNPIDDDDDVGPY